jgi:SufE protein probably involved in Fe-S center assembly
MLPDAQEIIENFELIDDWEERYRYLIELGHGMPPLPDSDRTAENKVLGCASQVWLKLDIDNVDGKLVLRLIGDSDAHIVRGLVALMISLYSGTTPEEALAIDPIAILSKIGLEQHLTPQRSNGLRSMVERIRHDAAAAIG